MDEVNPSDPPDPEAAVLESDPEHAVSIRKGLVERGINASIHGSYLDFIRAVGDCTHDVLVVDLVALGPPDRLDAIRECCPAPLLALYEFPEQAIAALENGATAVLAKQVDSDVLGAAASALLRDHHPAPVLETGATTQIGDLQVSLINHTVERRGRRQILSATEWQLFSFFLSHPGRTLSRGQLADGAWGSGNASRTAQIELYISRLRRKVERNPREPLLIETVRGAGYRLSPRLPARATAEAVNGYARLPVASN